MPTKFDYICDNCFKKSDNEHMSSMICKCGGTMRLDRGFQGIAFQPFYSRELGAYITNSRQEANLLKEKGLSYMRDYSKMIKKAKQFRKYKEDMNAEVYAKENLKYPKGFDTRFDEKRKEFVKLNGERFYKKTFISVVGFLLITSFAFAFIDGIERVSIEVNEVTYRVPIGNKDRQSDIYYLKKALNGDKEAREVFLGGQDEKWFFIGEENPLWLVVGKDSEKVIKP
jgi:hypothetical protein